MAVCSSLLARRAGYPPHLALGKLQQRSRLLLQIPGPFEASGVGDGGQAVGRRRSPLRRPSDKHAPPSLRAAQCEWPTAGEASGGCRMGCCQPGPVYIPCSGAGRSRPASSHRIGRWLTRAPAAAPAPAAVASAAPSSAATSPISRPATMPQTQGTSAGHAEDKRGRLPTLGGPSRAGRPHLELKLQPLFRVSHARDAGMEGRDRLAKGIARDVVAGLIVHHMRRAYHLVHPDDRLLSAPPVRRPAQVERPTPVKLRVGWTFDRARAAHIAAAQSQQQIFRRRQDT